MAEYKTSYKPTKNRGNKCFVLQTLLNGTASQLNNAYSQRQNQSNAFQAANRCEKV